MDAFSYLSVLLSIILGLAITQLLQGFGQMLQGRERVRWHWPSVLWMVSLLLIYVQSWWAMFGLRDVKVWTFGAFAVVLLQTILEYLLAALLVPPAAPEVDLRAHYFAQRRPFFATLILVLMVSLGKEVLLSGALPISLNVGFHFGWMGLSVLAMVIRRDWFHGLAAVMAFAGLVAYIILLFTQLR
jgi:hypothetical protein